LNEIPIPNPVKLSPFRTFIEVEQPESLFVLRGRKGPQWALFEADGGLWKIKAIQNIKNWLEKKELNVPIIA
jgi:hypothetical protein